MSRFQPLEAISDIFTKNKAPGEKATGKDEELRPLQYLHELQELFDKRKREDEDPDPRVMRRRFAIARAIGKLLKPLLYFENLLPGQALFFLERARPGSLLLAHRHLILV
jgi:hypothetical protein